MGGSKKRLFIILNSLIVFIVVAWGDALFATHEVDHRYTIFGYVWDEKGMPISDARVIVTDTKMGEGSTTFTRKDGSYEVILHLHNQNIGDEIAISAHGEEKRITATFDPQDRFTERRRRVDFGPDITVKSSEMNIWIYYTAGLILLTGTLIYLGVYWKRRERHEGPKGKKIGRLR